MTEGAKPMRFFLGANTPQGFVSRFDQLEREKDGWNTYIIKGGPGTGKSTLMKHIAQAFRQRGEAVEEIYCSSDSGSLDGVILRDRRASVADGTPPHTLEPKYPGAYDTTVNLNECWNEDLLRSHRGEIIALNRRIAALHGQSTRFLAAYDALASDNTRIALECTDTKKINEYARRLALREMRGGPASDAPHEDIRFISAVCDRGVWVFEETARALADRIYVVEDPNSASSAILLSELRAQALARGLDIVSCYCPIHPDGRLEHLFIPSLSLGFMTSNRAHSITLEAYRTIHSRRFTDADALRRKKQRMAFNRKAAAEMLREAVECLSAAKELHDALESFYIGAMDFNQLEQRQNAVIKRILS